MATMKNTILRETMRLTIDKMAKLNRSGMPKNTHFTYIIIDNQIVEYGVNRYQDIPKHWGYDITFQGLHSEMCAYIRGCGLLKGKQFSIVNIRLDNQLHMKIAKPCEHCERMMVSLGCRECVYTTLDGWVTEKY